MGGLYIPEPIEPNEYCGLVFDLPRDQIPIRLAQEVARVGFMKLWEFQHFVHHDHPTIPGDDFEDEIVQSEAWERTISARFPTFRFVIEISPFDRMSWYQAIGEAPTLDDADWQIYAGSIKMSGAEIRVRMQRLLDTTPEGKEATEEYNKAWLKIRTPRIGSEGSCEKCGDASGFTEPSVSSRHRGVKLITCLGCGQNLVHSTRLIRNRVGFDVRSTDRDEILR